MKIQLIVEILVILALIAFASARVIDSRDNAEFTSRLLKNLTKINLKTRQNEIVVGGPDYDDANISGEISVGDDDLLSNSVPNEPASVIVTEVVSGASNEDSNNVSIQESDSAAVAAAATDAPVNIDDAHPLNRYCTCNENECNCCREFKLPLVSVRGPGCATVRYLGKNKMSVALKYGDITLTTRTISGRKARPICVNLPGGYTKFCGRVYGISRADEDFSACLGLELRADDEVEAALRVSCFQFGPRGLKMTDAKPLPPVVDTPEDDDEEDGGLLGLVAGGSSGEEDEDDEDDEADDDEATGDDDTDLLGFADDDEDDEDDADDEEEEADDDDDDDEAAPVAAGSDDYTSGFSLLDGLFGGGSGSSANKKKKPVQNRNKAPEDLKAANQIGTKVKIPNSPAILSSAALSQNEIDSTLNKDQQQVSKVEASVAAVANEVAAPVVAAAAAAEKPRPAIEQVVAAAAESNAIPELAVAGTAVTTPKPKKKPPTSFLDTIEALITGGDDDDDDDEDDDEEDDDAEETENVKEEEEEEEEEADDEEPEDAKEEEEEDEEEEANDEDEDEDGADDDETEYDDVENAEKVTNDKQTTAQSEGAAAPADKKKTKKKSDYGFGLFARLLRLI